MVHLRQIAAGKCARVGECRRKDLRTTQFHPHGRPPGDLEQRTDEGPQRVHPDGPSRGAVSEPSLREDRAQLDSLGGQPMTRGRWLVALAAGLLVLPAAPGQREPIRLLAFWSANVEGDHVEFGREALEFYRRAAAAHRFQFESTANWDDLNAKRLQG